MMGFHAGPGAQGRGPSQPHLTFTLCDFFYIDGEGIKHVTGRVFTKLFFSFVVVLFLGMVVLDFSLRQVMEQSLRTQAEESLVGQARLLAAHLSAFATPLDAPALQEIAAQDALAAGAEVSIFDAQGQRLAASRNDAAGDVTPSPEVAAVAQRHQTLGRARRDGNLYVAVPAGAFVVRLAFPLRGVPSRNPYRAQGNCDGFAALSGDSDSVGSVAGAASCQASGADRGVRQSDSLR